MNAISHLLDRSMYFAGREVSHRDGMRKFRDRQAIHKGQVGTIIRVAWQETYYDIVPRCLVNWGEFERWVDGSTLHLHGESLDIAGDVRRLAEPNYR